MSEHTSHNALPLGCRILFHIYLQPLTYFNCSQLLVKIASAYMMNENVSHAHAIDISAPWFIPLHSLEIDMTYLITAAHNSKEDNIVHDNCNIVELWLLWVRFINQYIKLLNKSYNEAYQLVQNEELDLSFIYRHSTLNTLSMQPFQLQSIQYTRLLLNKTIDQSKLTITLQKRLSKLLGSSYIYRSNYTSKDDYDSAVHSVHVSHAISTNNTLIDSLEDPSIDITTHESTRNHFLRNSSRSNIELTKLVDHSSFLLHLKELTIVPHHQSSIINTQIALTSNRERSLSSLKVEAGLSISKTGRLKLKTSNYFKISEQITVKPEQSQKLKLKKHSVPIYSDTDSIIKPLISLPPEVDDFTFSHEVKLFSLLKLKKYIDSYKEYVTNSCKTSNTKSFKVPTNSGTQLTVNSDQPMLYILYPGLF